MLIVDTRRILYMKRPEGKNLRLYDVLKSRYNEMIKNKYDCEVNQKMDLFNKRWGKCEGLLRNIIDQNLTYIDEKLYIVLIDILPTMGLVKCSTCQQCQSL